jgi:hypothetical protein
MSTQPNKWYDCKVPLRLEGFPLVYRHVVVQGCNFGDARRNLRRMLRRPEFGAMDMIGTHRGRWSRQPGRLPKGTLVEEQGVVRLARMADKAHPPSPSRCLDEQSVSLGRSPRSLFRLLPSLTSARPRSRFLPLVRI